MKKNATINLKRAIIITVGGLMLIGLLAAGIFTTGNQINFIRPAQAQAENDPIILPPQRNFICSNATLKGRYATIGDGFAAPPPNPLLPFATVTLMTMDGVGNLTNKVTRSNNGNISRGIDSGTYNVNSDCTGTITIITPNPPFQLTFDLVIADLQGAAQGKEFYFIATTPGGAVTSTAKRMQ
jgi:hypothetical protein